MNKHSSITLDEFELKDVIAYELKQEEGKLAELTVKLLVATSEVKADEFCEKEMIIPLGTPTWTKDISKIIAETIKNGTLKHS